MQTVARLPKEEKRGQGLDRRPAVLMASPIGGFLGASLPVTPVQRNVFSLLLFLVSSLAFFKPLEALWSFALREESFSHVVLIPLVVGYLLVVKRASILTSKEWSPALGLSLVTIGAISYWATSSQAWTPDRLAMVMAALVVTWWGLFLLSFGLRSFRQNLFALAFLLFMIPLPSFALDTIIGFLQQSSAEAATVLFSALGIPVFRQGFIFSLSHFTIHVAEECSGIRSFFSLLITSLIAGYWFLRSGWSRAALAGIVVPLAIIKNAFRIVGLALLANYIDPAFITNSPLHRSGGIPLFALSLVALAGIVWVLRRGELRWLELPSQDSGKGRPIT